ncbi:hypothetical protein RI662_10635 [Brevibacillus agri]|uniref:hypothetical protein n=1 Tax=Brevibacillus agri TaxID=51101 RepID=UPI0002A4F31F|nr:hypothetical protein [Brevibacillus agri]ELK39060.1 hypothetical protein D478_26549 [Brevibacillus agri BAB-2500]MDR9504746.1 hypothetical protein [Brevibacillus agri]
MSRPSKVVLEYLLEESNLNCKASFVERIGEITESYETVPEEVADAYEQLTVNEFWEIIRKIAVEGKRRTNHNLTL